MLAQFGEKWVSLDQNEGGWVPLRGSHVFNIDAPKRLISYEAKLRLGESLGTFLSLWVSELHNN